MAASGARRRFSIGLMLAWLVPGFFSRAAATPDDIAARLAKLDLSRRGISLDFPALADTGTAVPLRVEVTPPAALTLAAIEIILPENPNPAVLKASVFDPPRRYAFSTRIRLAASQDVWVIATLSDGSELAAHAPTVITSSACLDATQ